MFYVFLKLKKKHSIGMVYLKIVFVYVAIRLNELEVNS